MPKVRVLQVNIGTTVFGGVEKILYDIYKHIDRDKVQFDFLSPNGATYKICKSEIEKLGGKILDLKNNRRNLKEKILYDIKLHKFLKSNKYDIIHINSGVFFFCLQVALIAKINGVKKIIVHSHNNIKNSKIKGILIKILKPILNNIVDERLACSRLAGEAMFYKKSVEQGKVKIIKNGLEIEKFKFDKSIRDEYRKKMNLEENVIYGHIGRFELEKNHDFLIDIFYEIQKKQENAKLLLVGEGKLKDIIKEKVEKLNISDKVKFLGLRKDVNNILQAIDCFIFPSKYEGLGIVAIEAQTAGVYTVCSETIPIEAKISDKFKFINLEQTPEVWAKIIYENQCINNMEYRKEAYKNTIRNGYDINSVSEELEKIYLN
ncbi:MAG: glycosyltransferase [Clostridia bacterium]|nr:glycosyltransferase [Clostridia bacterium]